MQLSSVSVKFMVIKVKLHFDAPRAHCLNCLARAVQAQKQGSIKARTFPFKLTALAATMFGQRGGYPMRMPEVVLSGQMTRHRL
jgi:hypothetical protein